MLQSTADRRTGLEFPGETSENSEAGPSLHRPGLKEIIDVSAVQSLMEDFYRLTRLPVSIIDLEGDLLVGVGWQTICAQYHRVHPETCRFCLESDTQLSAGVLPGKFRLYRCKNNMWDVATPIFIGGAHAGNLFSGQFFFRDEPLDYELFRAQARRYDFDETAYLAALESVPRFERAEVERGLGFLTNLAQLLSRLGYSNWQLARSVEQREALMASLRESQHDLNHAQAVARTGSWRMDVQRNQLLWSEETYRIFGLERATPLTYEIFLNLVAPDDRDRVHASWMAALAGAPYDIEHRIVARGEIRWVRERAELEFDPGGALRGGFGTVQDVTERKQMELALLEKESLLRQQADRLEQTVKKRTAKLQETISELEHYSYSITHDLRAPLRTMEGFAAMLLEDCLQCPNTERLDLLRRIAKAARRMDQLIRDALNYSRVLRNELTLSVVDLETLLREIIETYPGFQPPAVQIEIVPPVPRVLGNEAALTQCFANLLTNASKFVAPGVRPRIRISSEQTGTKVRIWVEDNGIGIPPEWQERIFGMFQRHNADYEGTGIGLALVKKVVQRMSGTVGVQSEPGAGSRFWVELPGTTLTQ